MYELDFIMHKHFLDKCLSGDVCLFTGSGFSIGAKVKKVDILTTHALIDSILREFMEINNEEQIERIKKNKNFQQVCQYSITIKSEDLFDEYITNKFKDAIPDPFHYNYNQIEWKDIFTTNVDDIVEEIYKRTDIKLQVINTRKQPDEYTGENTLKYYKLHGDVNNKSEGFIFSHAQYMKPLTSNNFYYPILKFTEKLYRDTFCFIGSNFNEIDIEKYIHTFEKQVSTSLPQNKIYYISKTIHPEDVSELATRNIIPIQETAQSFIEKLLEYKKIQKTDINSSKMKIVKKVDTCTKLEKMGFICINEENLNLDTEKIKKHKPLNFYEGYSPKWLDIASNSDAILSPTKNIINIIEDDIKTFKLILLVGKSGNGKSTALKRILYNFSLDNDYIVCEHLNINEINNSVVNDIVRLINNESKKLIFGFDNGSWSFKFIENIYSKLDNDKKVTFIVTSRYPEFYREKNYITGIKKDLIYFDDNLEAKNAGLIIDALDNKGYLGGLAQYPTRDKKVQALLKLKTSTKDLFSCLIGATHGDGFFERINEHIDQSLSENAINVKLLFLLALLDKFGSLVLSKSIFYNVFKNEIEDFNVLQERLSNLTDNNSYTNMDYIKLRGEYITDYILRRIRLKKYLKNEDIFEITSKVLMYTASLYDIDKRRKRSYKTELSSLLLNSRNYINYLNIREKRHYDDFYNKLKSYYKDLAPFWLYYARMEMKLNDLKSAWIHLEQAKALSNSYEIEHTIGQWHLTKAREIDKYDEAIIEFEKGEKIMQKQIQFGDDAYPIHTFIEEYIYFFKKHKNRINNTKIRLLVNQINDAKKEFSNQVIVLIIWKKFYHFLKELGLSNIMSLKLEDLKLMEKIDLSKSAEEQYHLLNLE